MTIMKKKFLLVLLVASTGYLIAQLVSSPANLPSLKYEAIIPVEDIDQSISELIETKNKLLQFPGVTTYATYNYETSSFDCQNSDCFFAAVDKTYALPSSYSPEVVAVGSGLTGYMVPEAAQALRELNQAAKELGINIEVTSSYRSYTTQEITFNNWVVIVKNRDGLTQEEAETEANTFSALPGHSEHQLGTTADINTVGATPFDHEQNAALYKFIEDSAHLHGFVITYPKNQESITGYVHEPWHIRYLGVAVASSLKETGYTSGNGIYSTQFLKDNLLSR